MSYGTQFASVTATIVHTILYFRRTILVQLRPKDRQEPPDIHERLMRAYPKVPNWWYAVVFGITFMAGVVCIQLWDNHMTVWAFVIALIISLLFVIPIGM